MKKLGSVRVHPAMAGDRHEIAVERKCRRMGFTMAPYDWKIPIIADSTLSPGEIVVMEKRP